MDRVTINSHASAKDNRAASRSRVGKLPEHTSTGLALHTDRLAGSPVITARLALEEELRQIAATQVASRRERVASRSAGGSPGAARPALESRQCRKVRFRDHSQAIAALHALYAGSNRAQCVVRVYECGACHGWHLTSQHDLISAERRPTVGQRRAIPAVSIRDLREVPPVRTPTSGFDSTAA